MRDVGGLSEVAEVQAARRGDLGERISHEPHPAGHRRVDAVGDVVRLDRTCRRQRARGPAHDRARAGGGIRRACDGVRRRGTGRQSAGNRQRATRSDEGDHDGPAGDERERAGHGGGSFRRCEGPVWAPRTTASLDAITPEFERFGGIWSGRTIRVDRATQPASTVRTVLAGRVEGCVGG